MYIFYINNNTGSHSFTAPFSGILQLTLPDINPTYQWLTITVPSTPNTITKICSYIFNSGTIVNLNSGSGNVNFNFQSDLSEILYLQSKINEITPSGSNLIASTNYYGTRGDSWANESGYFNLISGYIINPPNYLELAVYISGHASFGHVEIQTGIDTWLSTLNLQQFTYPSYLQICNQDNVLQMCHLVSGIATTTNSYVGKLSYDYITNKLAIAGNSWGFIPIGTSGMPIYQSNIDAANAGLISGQFYRSPSGVLKVRY
jgi:hypothetical protein